MPAIGGMMETSVYTFIGLMVMFSLGAYLSPRRHSSELPSPEVRYKHQTEYQEALDEIVRLDALNDGLQLRNDEVVSELESFEIEIKNLHDDKKALQAELAEAIQSAEHWQERFKTSEEIRQKLAASLSGRCCGGQITMGNTEAKVVHGSVVVSDPDVRGGFLDICNSEKKDA